VIFVLDEVQILDQEVAAARPVSQQKSKLLRRYWIDLAPLGGRFGPLPSFARMFEWADLLHVVTHQVPIPYLEPTLKLGMPDAKKENVGPANI
jgi:hypothetical protein